MSSSSATSTVTRQQLHDAGWDYHSVRVNNLRDRIHGFTSVKYSSKEVADILLNHVQQLQSLMDAHNAALKKLYPMIEKMSAEDVKAITHEYYASCDGFSYHDMRNYYDFLELPEGAADVEK